MADKTFRWVLPTTRVDGSVLPLSSIRHVAVYLDVGGGFGLLAEVPPNTLSLLQTDLIEGDYVVRGVVVDRFGLSSAPVDLPFQVAPTSNPGALIALSVE